MANKAKENWKKVPLHIAYQRGYEVQEYGLDLLKETWLQNLEGMALESFKMGVSNAIYDLSNAALERIIESKKAAKTAKS